MFSGFLFHGKQKSLLTKKQLLKTIDFILSDVYVRTIDLRGMPISFSLIFMLQDD